MPIETTSPALRFEKLLSSPNAIERTITELPSFKTALRRINLPCKVGKETMCSPQEAKEEWTRALRTSADGRTMITDDIDPASYHQQTPHSLPVFTSKGNSALWGNTTQKLETPGGERNRPTNWRGKRDLEQHTTNMWNHTQCQMCTTQSCRKTVGEGAEEESWSDMDRAYYPSEKNQSSNQTFW